MGLCAHCMCRSTMPPREHQQMFEKEQRPPHNSPEKNTPKQCQTGYSSRPPKSSDQNQTLLNGWPRVCIIFQVSSKSVQGFRRCVGSKMALPITLASGLYNSLYYRTSHSDVTQLTLLSFRLWLWLWVIDSDIM